jgi:hypothetical protein
MVPENGGRYKMNRDIGIPGYRDIGESGNLGIGELEVLADSPKKKPAKKRYCDA